MRAHLVQLDMAWEDRPANHAAADRLLDRAGVAPGDLVLLPEMYDTGFSMRTGATADRGGATLRHLIRIATDLGVVVQGGRTVHDCHCALASNRATVIGPGGDLLAEYRKIHPFSLGREHEHFAGGTEVVTYSCAAGPDGALVVCPAVCYDLRFPEVFRLGLLRGAEVFAVIACWPEARQAHWRTLLSARAVENQAYVLGCNRAGRDPHAAYAGGSVVFGPRGEVVGELGAEEGVLSVPVEPAAVRGWRAKFPAWRDHRLLGAAVGSAGAMSAART